MNLRLSFAYHRLLVPCAAIALVGFGCPTQTSNSAPNTTLTASGPSGPSGASSVLPPTTDIVTSPGFRGLMPSPLDQIVITFPEPLDPTSVQRATTTLLGSRNKHGVRLSVSTKRALRSPTVLVITPEVVLPREAMGFHVSGLAYQNGAQAPVVEFPFTVRRLKERWTVSYLEGVAMEATHQVFGDTEQSEITLSPRNDQDARYDNQDIRYYERTTQVTDRSDERLVYNGAGKDSTWLTDDDVVFTRSQDDFDLERRVTNVTEYRAGPDGRMLTGDDVEVLKERIDYEAEGPTNMAVWIGNDGVAGNADDVRTCGLTVYDERGRVQRTTERTMNAAFLCNGNTTSSRTIHENEYDDQGRLVVAHKRWWLSENNATIRRTRFTYDARGLKIATETEDAGGDGLWGTADDQTLEFSRVTYDDDLASREVTYDAGFDGREGGGDDVKIIEAWDVL